MYCSTPLDARLKLTWKGNTWPAKALFLRAQVVVGSSGTAAVQAIWCHDITVAWVRIPAREEPKICESKFTDQTLLG